LPSAVLATPLTQISDGQKCGELNRIGNDGVFYYICSKRGRNKVWRLQGQIGPSTTNTILIAPAAPTGLTFTVTSPFDGTGTISWTRSSYNEDYFYISAVDPLKLAGLPLSAIWGKTQRGELAITPSGMKSGLNYCFWVMSSNAAGNSAWVGPACAMAGVVTTTTASTTTTTSTTTTSTSTTVALRKPPSGDYWERQHFNSSNILMYGNPYRLYLCTNGSANAILMLYVNILNTWVKRADSYGTTSDSACTGDYPTTQSFYYFIDWTGTPISNTRATLNFKVTGLNQDYFYSRTIWPSQGAANQEATELALKIACLFGKRTGCK